MLGVLRVSNAGLQALAEHCSVVSAGLAASAPVPDVGPPIQATIDAVGTTCAARVRAGAVLAGRAQTHGIKTAQAGADIVVADDAGANEMGDVGDSTAGASAVQV